MISITRNASGQRAWTHGQPLSTDPTILRTERRERWSDYRAGLISRTEWESFVIALVRAEETATDQLARDIEARMVPRPLAPVISINRFRK